MQPLTRWKVARRLFALTSIVFPSLVAVVMLASCTASGPLQAPNMASVLTPDASDTEPEDAIASKIAANTPSSSGRPNGVPKPRPSKTEPEPQVKNALVADSTSVAPAAKAANQLAAGTPSAKSTATTTETKAASTTPSEDDTKPAAKTGSGSSFFANLFQNSQSSSAQTATSRTGVKRTVTVKRSTRKRSARSLFSFTNNSLPGVRGSEIYGIDEADELKDGVRLASVTNRARRGSHGLLLQREGVRVGCFPPQLVRLLKQVERKFGRTPIVTSGYRTRKHNRMIRGARNSMHIQCKAADIQVQGVSKSRLAKYLRSLPGRGGVGTYCHTKSVHVDIGRKRDWNRRCRRTRARKT
ncbi:MAG: YcbK family protein [Hyphomicrobiales bacterium]